MHLYCDITVLDRWRKILCCHYNVFTHWQTTLFSHGRGRKRKDKPQDLVWELRSRLFRTFTVFFSLFCLVFLFTFCFTRLLVCLKSKNYFLRVRQEHVTCHIVFTIRNLGWICYKKGLMTKYQCMMSSGFYCSKYDVSTFNYVYKCLDQENRDTQVFLCL